MTYRSAYSLDVLLGEVNAYAPSRSKISDGWIGDADHASRDSDHNPWVIKNGEGIVRARDFTHDPSGGLDAGYLAALLARLLNVHPAMGYGAYVIHNRRIISAARLNEGWRPYFGKNAHTKHVHVSVCLDPDGFDSRAPWLQEEDDMTPDEYRKIAAEERAKTVDAVRNEIRAALADGGDLIKLNNPFKPEGGDISLATLAKSLVQRTAP